MEINLGPMTDEKIDKLAKAEWMSILAQLWHATGKPVEKLQFETYIKQLGHIPLGLLEGAVAHVLSTHVYNNVPTIAEVLNAVEAIAPGDWREQEYVYIHNRPHREAAQKSQTKDSSPG
jgi:hypothetical protein